MRILFKGNVLRIKGLEDITFKAWRVLFKKFEDVTYKILRILVYLYSFAPLHYTLLYDPVNFSRLPFQLFKIE